MSTFKMKLLQYILTNPTVYNHVAPKTVFTIPKAKERKKRWTKHQKEKLEGKITGLFNEWQQDVTKKR